MGKSSSGQSQGVSNHQQADALDTGDALPPSLPAEFWNQAEIQQACREQHFGYLLKSYRELQNPPMTQGELARLLSLTQGQISRIERSSKPITDLSKLARWADTLGVPESILWFRTRHANDSKSSSANTDASNMDGSEEGEDMRRRDLIKSVGVGAALLGTSIFEDAAVTTPQSSRAVGMETVEIMREWTRTFRRVDNRFGGGYSLSQIGKYLTEEVMPKVTDSRCNDKVRRELHSTASELYQLAGWMSYDIGNTEQGRKCLSRALKLSQTAANQPFTAELLAGMSHQASFLRRPEDAVDFALAAKEAARRTGLNALVSEAAVMAAHGYAQQGDKRACLTELQEAEAEFCRIRRADTPDWLGYFDEAYLSAKFGHALKDLGEATQAERFAVRSLQMNEGYDRGRVFNLALLASTLAEQGKVDEAVSYGRQATELAGTVRSQRTTAYLSEVAERLWPYSDNGEVRTLHKQMSARRIPLQRL